MRPLSSLLVYLAAVFLLGTALAPWLYWLAQWGAGHFAWLDDTARIPFHRFVSRSMQIVALLGLWPFLRSVGIRSWRDLGIQRTPECWSLLGRGFAFSFVWIFCILLLESLAGTRTFDIRHSFGALCSRLLNASLSAILVSILEETLFRGALFGALRRTGHWTLALVTSSAVYAIVHFFQRPASPASVTWTSGWQLLPQMLQGFLEIDRLLPGFLVLTCAGMVLGLAYQKSGSLFFPIGLHAGWIFWTKSHGLFTRSQPGSSRALGGARGFIDDWLTLALLVVGLMALWAWARKKHVLADAR